jgi:hypothetical protein
MLVPLRLCRRQPLPARDDRGSEKAGHDQRRSRSPFRFPQRSRPSGSRSPSAVRSAWKPQRHRGHPADAQLCLSPQPRTPTRPEYPAAVQPMRWRSTRSASPRALRSREIARSGPHCSKSSSMPPSDAQATRCGSPGVKRSPVTTHERPRTFSSPAAWAAPRAFGSPPGPSSKHTPRSTKRVTDSACLSCQSRRRFR